MRKHIDIVMNIEEKRCLRDLSHRLTMEGKNEEALEVALKMPLAPHLALAAKETYGIDFILDFNLSEANRVYGNDWLTK